MRVCIVSGQHRSAYSGIGYHSRMLVNGPCARGHSVALVVPEDEAPDPAPAGCSIQAFPFAARGWHADWLAMASAMRDALRPLLRAELFDVVYFTQAREAARWDPAESPCPVAGGVHDYYFAAAPGSPVAFRGAYGDWPVRWTYYRIVRILERRAFRRVAGLVCNSRATCDAVARGYGANIATMSVVQYGVEPSPREEPPAGTANPAPSPREEGVLLFVGGNFERKGLPTVIRALPAIAERIPAARLVVAGSCRSLPAMKKLAGALGVLDRIEFLGFQPNDTVRWWMRRAEVFVMPSLMEGFVIVFLEAMRTGLPVVGSRTGGIPEVVRDGENGLLVPPGDVKMLADACSRLLADGGLRERLASGGSATVGLFPPEQMIAATERFLADLEMPVSR